MALLQLFVASSMPVIKVLLITALGSCLALEHVNVLGEDARKHLNKVLSLLAIILLLQFISHCYYEIGLLLSHYRDRCLRQLARHWFSLCVDGLDYIFTYVYA